MSDCKSQPSAGLQVGDEVLIKAGYGVPRASHDRTEVVVAVNGMAAMTERGTLIPCMNKPVFVRTGQRRESVTIPDRVREIIRGAKWPGS